MGLRSDPASARERVRRAALKALKRARRQAELEGACLSEWEGEFLASVESRVERYGRAFRDPEKGPPGATLSILQRVKLKEISAKAKGKASPTLSRRGRLVRGRTS